MTHPCSAYAIHPFTHLDDGDIPLNGETLGIFGGTFGPHTAQSPVLFGRSYEMTGANLFQRLLIAMVELLGQPSLTYAEPLGMGRAEQRRWTRHGLTPVRRLRLRHAHSDADGDGDGFIEWSHSWTVRGHWRNQACGKKWLERRLIWVHPYVKGEGAHDERQTIFDV
jgi:hypothetical protein